ncbi:MAG TPA: preprotein translocase subunit SecY [Candidatus Baltobacteraceae bacterium]|nr:preprotein translocase subunit SecY [Candidatus Baltobacteraceae bacterium]
MFDNLRAAVLVPDIRKRIGFVLFAFAWFIFMIHVQLPNVNEAAWQNVLKSGQFYTLLGFLSGGALQKLSIIAMGITPYINASIIMQLMTVVLPQLEELAKKGGEEGRKKIGQYTRWLTIVLALLQATFMTNAMKASGVFYDTSLWYQLFAITAMVAGTLFLMWLGEQISDKGIGNGVSLIIFIGIVLRYPQYVGQTYSSAAQGGLSLLNLVLFILITIAIIIGIIFMYQGQRRVPVQQARRVVGRKMFAGRSTYIPLRLNNAGVISIIFAISILLLPQQALAWFSGHAGAAAPAYHSLFVLPGLHWNIGYPTNLAAVSELINVYFAPGGTLYNITYFLLVVVFTFFYSSVVLNTRDVADNLKKTGAFIPGIRPGQPTVDYLNRILMRLTTAAAIFLGVLAVAPNVLERGLSITTIYLGSTSLLIVVGVALDTISQIEARLAMRDYRGFIKR